MLFFPEMFSGNGGMSSSQFAIANGDQSGGASNQLFELFNPSLTGTAQGAVGNVPLITVTGLIVSVATANADLKIFSTTNSAVVAGAATSGPLFMDSRRSDAPTATFKIGQAANPGSGLITTVPLVFNTPAMQLPFNWDLPAGNGLVFSVAGANRAVLTVFWIERQMTS